MSLKSEGSVSVTDEGNIRVEADEITAGCLELPPLAMTRLALLLLRASGCVLEFNGPIVTVDTGRVSARELNTDARRRLDA